MRLKAVLACAALCTAAIPAALPAQLNILPGSRIRVTAPNLVAPLVANFLEQRGDTLVFIEEGTGRGVWSFALAQVEKLETTGGEAGRNRPYVAKGAAIGAGSGLVAGLLFAAAASPSDSGKTYDRPMTGLVGAVVGAGIGAFIGSRMKAERWVNVPLPGRLSLVPSRHGLTVGYSLR